MLGLSPNFQLARAVRFSTGCSDLLGRSDLQNVPFISTVQTSFAFILTVPDLPQSVLTVQVLPEQILTVPDLPQSILTIQVLPEQILTVKVLPRSI